MLRLGVPVLLAVAALGAGPHVKPARPPAPEEKPPAEEPAPIAESAPPPVYGLPSVEVPRLEDLLRPLEGARLLRLAVCPSPERQSLLEEYAALGEEVTVLARVLGDAGEWREADAERARIEAERLRGYATGETPLAGGIPAGGAEMERVAVYDDDLIPALERIVRDTEEAWMRGEIGFADRLRVRTALLDLKGERLALRCRPGGRETPVPPAPEKKERKRR